MGLGAASAASVDFTGQAPGTVVLGQYAEQGVAFAPLGVVLDVGGNPALRAADTAAPALVLNFTTPVYSFSARLREYLVGEAVNPPPDLPPGSDDDPVDPVPPVDDSKQMSVLATLRLAGGGQLELPAVHAYGAWQPLAWQGSTAVGSIALLGLSADPDYPLYFVIDDIAFSTTAPVPEPTSAALLCAGLLGLVAWARRRRPG